LYNSIIDINENKYLTAKEVKNRLIDPVLAPKKKKKKACRCFQLMNRTHNMIVIIHVEVRMRAII